MPGMARNKIVDRKNVGVYHVWGRCVRRAWLCGNDPLTGVDHSERREWIRRLEEQLASLFAIEIEFHTEMNNYLELIVRTRPDIVATWPDDEVVRRMLIVHRLIRSKNGQVNPPSVADIQIELANPERAGVLRDRLCDLSWFMKALNETIARRANQSDGVTGSFWDGRFKCQRLIDETAIVICGIYVDLSQILAREVATPEQSTHTSAYDRMCGWRWRMRRCMPLPNSPPGPAEANPAILDEAEIAMGTPDGWLGELTLQTPAGTSEADWDMRSQTGRRASDKGLLPLSLETYVDLLNWTAAQLREGKPGAVPDGLIAILERFRIRSDRWLDLIQHFKSYFRNFVGHIDELRRVALQAGKRYLRGIRQCAAAFVAPPRLSG